MYPAVIMPGTGRVATIESGTVALKSWFLYGLNRTSGDTVQLSKRALFAPIPTQYYTRIIAHHFSRFPEYIETRANLNAINLSIGQHRRISDNERIEFQQFLADRLVQLGVDEAALVVRLENRVYDTQTWNVLTSDVDYETVIELH